MTNAQIVLAASVQLMKDGIIGSTGRKFTFEDAEGKKIEIDEPEAIHTYNGWKELGYQVKKGEKAIAQFNIWKYKSKMETIEGEDTEGNQMTIAAESRNMFMKRASWFKASQVEAIATI